jgi:hypothetical protein
MTVVDLFFRLFFDEFEFFYFSEKGYWARCFGKSFGAAVGVRAGFWGHRGGVQEASSGVLGLSGVVRGASWEGLGRSWGDLGATFKAVRFRIVFLIDFERQKGAQREAFWNQNGAKIDPKIIQNRSRFSRAKKYPSRSSWDRLGAVLGRSWAILTGLGAILGRSWAGWGSQKH